MTTTDTTARLYEVLKHAITANALPESHYLREMLESAKDGRDHYNSVISVQRQQIEESRLNNERLVASYRKEIAALRGQLNEKRPPSPVGATALA